MIRHFSPGVLLLLFLGVITTHCDAASESGSSGQDGHVDSGVVGMLVMRIESLEKQVEKQSEVNLKQSDVIQKLQLKLGNVEEELATLKSSRGLSADGASGGKDTGVVDISANGNAYKHQQTKRALMGSEAIAFTAYLDHNVTHLGIGHTITYNKVILNEGGAYNHNTGIFTCPYDGIYVFNFMVATDGVQQIVAKLVVDNVNMVDAISDTFHPYHEAQGGNYATLSLKAGQSVWVANYRWTDKGDYSSDANRFSTFSGHLVL